MRITLLAYGSRGDVQPYVALGTGLRQAGHSVCLAAPAPFEEFIRAHELAFAPLSGDPAQLAQTLADKAGRNPIRTLQAIGAYAIPLGFQVLSEARAACQDADVIIHSFLLTVAGHQIARELDVPDFSALVFPCFASTTAFPSPAFPWPSMGKLYNRLTHNIFTQSFWWGNRLIYNWVLRRKNISLPPLPAWPFDTTRKRPTPILYGISPNVIPKPPDWGEHIHVTGYWFLDASAGWQPPAGLLDFLAAGPPPVYIGFGSMITREASKLVEVVLGALSKSGQRGLLLSGWGGLAQTDLPANVFKIESAPHDWLFPRMAAIVHHGGAGTTAAALRSGAPAIITPFTADQPFWGTRVHQLGAGPKPIARKKLTAQNLAEAIDLAINDHAMRQRAAEIGQALRAEDGIAQATRIIERN